VAGEVSHDARTHGSLFATRLGVAVASVPVRAAGEPAPTWWANHCGCTWVAAWLTVRGREFIGGRELLGRDEWSDKIIWRDHKGQHDARHRPDLVGIRADGMPVAVEVELAQKSVERFEGDSPLTCFVASWPQDQRSLVRLRG
jgi:hypothetical protein